MKLFADLDQGVVVEFDQSIRFFAAQPERARELAALLELYALDVEALRAAARGEVH